MEISGFIINIISGISSAASCILAFYVFFNIDKVKLKIEKQANKYKEQHGEVVKNLKILRENLFYKDIIGLEIRSKIKEELYYLKKHFSHLLKKDIINRIDTVIKALINDNFNYNEVCNDIDYIIAQFRSDEL